MGEARFSIAYSAGKDSEALLALCTRRFEGRIGRVVFADTTNEFEATLRRVEEARKELEQKNIPLQTLRPYLSMMDGWRLFGVPSRACRWCCQTCKSGALARLHENDDLFVMGTRAIESRIRTEYGLEAEGKRLNQKQSLRPIYDWSTAEVWAYLFWTRQPFNDVYRHGHHRACCIVCPYSSPFEVRLSGRMEPQVVAAFRDEYVRQYPDFEQSFDRRYYGDNGTWSRRDATLLKGDFPTRERVDENTTRYVLTGERPNANWLRIARERYKTRVFEEGEGRRRTFTAKHFTVWHTGDNRRQTNTLDRAFYCVGCGYCVNYCREGAISIHNGALVIDAQACTLCMECVENRCIRAKALRAFGESPDKKKTANG